MLSAIELENDGNILRLEVEDEKLIIYTDGPGLETGCHQKVIELESDDIERLKDFIEESF